MKHLLISFILIFQIAQNSDLTKREKKIIGVWEFEYATTVDFENVGGNIYTNRTYGTVGKTTLEINENKTAFLKYSDKDVIIFNWEIKKKLVLTPQDNKTKDMYFDGDYTFSFQNKKKLFLKNNKFKISLKKS